MNTATPRRSAVGLTVPRRHPAAPDDDPIPGLRALVKAAGSNRHDQATVVIAACIEQGIDTATPIMDIMWKLGFNARHAGMTLRHGTGNNPQRHHWSRSEAGRFTLLA